MQPSLRVREVNRASLGSRRTSHELQAWRTGRPISYAVWRDNGFFNCAAFSRPGAIQLRTHILQSANLATEPVAERRVASEDDLKVAGCSVHRRVHRLLRDLTSRAVGAELDETGVQADAAWVVIAHSVRLKLASCGAL